jgi:fumarate reductase flavoprotein subunit
LPRSITWLFGVVIPLFLGTYAYAQTPPPLLLDKHTKADIECKACHGTTEPPKAVGMDVCISCHGAYEQLAEKTKKVAPNPHDSHLGEAECSTCHHIHKPSEDGCRACHEWGYKTP